MGRSFFSKKSKIINLKFLLFFHSISDISLGFSLHSANFSLMLKLSRLAQLGVESDFSRPANFGLGFVGPEPQETWADR